MPELPEVETVRRQLEDKILGKTIRSVEIREKYPVKSSTQTFKKVLEGNQFSSIERIGKLMQFFMADGKQVMLAHMKMTGQFLYQSSGEIKAGIYPLLYASIAGRRKTAGRFREEQVTKGLAVDHVHVLFHFEDSSVLAFRDQRKFGYLKLVSSDELEEINARFGIDPMMKNFTREAFQNAFSGRTKSLKAVLMDQHLIAGLGNIYTDEICHRAGIRPLRSVKRLKSKEISRLFEISKEVIEKAVKHHGTTFRDYTKPDGKGGSYAYQLQVYGRQGEKCLQCNQETITKVKYLGRGTHYCKSCQR